MFTLKVSIGSWGIGDRTTPKAHKELHVSFDLRLITSNVHWFIFHFFPLSTNQDYYNKTLL